VQGQIVKGAVFPDARRAWNGEDQFDWRQNAGWRVIPPRARYPTLILSLIMTLDRDLMVFGQRLSPTGP